MKIKKVTPLLPDTPPPLLCPELTPVISEYENPWFRVLSRGSYYSIEFERPQVVIVPLLEENSVIMVRVNRPLIDDFPLEFPAGDSMPGETPRMAAAREFREETGIHITDIDRFVPDLPLSEMPGRMPVLLSVFTVKICKQEFERRARYDDDIVSVEALPLSEMARKIVNGEIYLSSPMALASRLLLRANFGESILEKEKNERSS